MWLHLDLEGIELHLQITNYSKQKPDKYYDYWCVVDLTLDGKDWLQYHVSSEILLSCEVDEIRDTIRDLLERKTEQPKSLEFIEPDLTIDLFPPKLMNHDSKSGCVQSQTIFADADYADAELHIHLWDDGALSCNYISLYISETDLNQILTYFMLVTGEIKVDSREVQDLIQLEIIR